MYDLIINNKQFANKIFNSSIKKKGELYSASDLVQLGNAWRKANSMAQFDAKEWISSIYTQEFIDALNKEHGAENVLVRSNGNVWFHPHLLIDMTLAINPKLKIAVYEWLFSDVMKTGNDDSYHSMIKALCTDEADKGNLPAYIQEVADKIKLACGVESWEDATRKQHKRRQTIQNNIALLVDVISDKNEAIRLAILNTHHLAN